MSVILNFTSVLSQMELFNLNMLNILISLNTFKHTLKHTTEDTELVAMNDTCASLNDR